MTTALLTVRRFAAVLVVAVVPFAASSASASAASKHHAHRSKHASAPAKTAKAPAPATIPAPTAAPSVTSVISIGGYVFYNLTYAEAVAAWQAAVAAAPPGYVPPTVTSISVNTTVGGTAQDPNG